MLVALNYHLLSRRLKHPPLTAATEAPTDFPTATSCRNRTLGRLTLTAIIKPTRKQVV